MDEIKNPEDGLEKLVRKAAEEAHFELNEQAWNALDKQLETAFVPKKSLNWRKFIGPAILLVIVSLTNFWPIDAALINLAPSESKEVPKEAIQGESLKVEEANPRAEGIQTNGEVKKEKPLESLANVPAVEEQIRTNVASEFRVDENTSYFSAKQELINNTAQPTIALIDLIWTPLGLISDQPIFVELPSNFILKEELEDSATHKSKWAIAAFVSGDFSATGLSGFTKPGTLYGLNVEYFVNERWSLMTGFGYSNKVYSALGTEYEAPNWTQGVSYALNSVDAVCKVIDIPVNFRRYLETKKDHRFFTSAGLSSYLMLREDYQYDYNGNHPAWPTEWSLKNKNQHYLGILNFSVGYEKPLTDRLALGLEPFFKLPLTGIGAGEVKFLSFGANLAIKWR